MEVGFKSLLSVKVNFCSTWEGSGLAKEACKVSKKDLEGKKTPTYPDNCIFSIF